MMTSVAALWEEPNMIDAVFVAAGFGMFFVAVLYVFACDRL